MRARTLLRAGSLRSSTVWGLAVIALVLLLAACSSGPVPIAYDQDSCDYCRMQISDPRYGGELITRTGKVLKFDSIECMASYYAGLQDSTTVRSVWVSDYSKPGTLMAAPEAVYIRHAGPGSPMGKGLLALAAGSTSGTAGTVPPGDTLSWSTVVELVRREGLTQGSGTADANDAQDHATDAFEH